MTATIRPRLDAAYVGRLDPDVRRADYLRAMSFYAPLAGDVFDRIIFADNSGEPLDEFEPFAAANPRISLMSYYGLDYPAAYGRAYGEMKIIEHAMEHANNRDCPLKAARPEAGQARYVWKVTGRYIITNIRRIVSADQSRRRHDLICHSRHYPRRWTELFCFGWSPAGYQRFVSRLAEQLRHDVTELWPEVLMNALVEDKRKYGDIAARCRFPVTPWIIGYRGLNGAPFHTRAQYVKHYAREMARVGAPWLWV